ncbi:MAG TPA: winged helix-turn-helix transcriptional regulator [Actinocrinis sp.]|uniref:winged helix-turn-helix transcriptional regulator n=1 Tax=Actinocrinis sp. TaxID=1920516 RepID=UPI002D38B76B|nr:winged helix-turn-helix transcriptional regulator [Actinocrinis sp.]HZU57841.1 winged helix-turn-helix transcriptional regulator [Actinocrinis sp.]
MATSRTYEDSCGVAHALELVGERWALLVVRELMLGAKRFGDIKAGLPGISANVLSHRLDELERAGLVTRRKLPKPAAVWVYDLTPWARDLEPIMQVLGRWAARDPQHRKDLHFGTASLILSLRTNFDPSLAEGVNLVVALRPGDESFVARVARKKLTIDTGEAEEADATIAGDARAFASVTYGGRPLADAVATGDLVVMGTMAAADSFLHLYSLPPVATV